MLIADEDEGQRRQRVRGRGTESGEQLLEAGLHGCRHGLRGRAVGARRDGSSGGGNGARVPRGPFLPDGGGGGRVAGGGGRSEAVRIDDRRRGGPFGGWGRRRDDRPRGRRGLGG